MIPSTGSLSVGKSNIPLAIISHIADKLCINLEHFPRLNLFCLKDSDDDVILSIIGAQYDSWKRIVDDWIRAENADVEMRGRRQST